MKSCRNCAHSRHEGSLRVDLVCPVIGVRIAQPSMSVEENRKADQHCRNLAAGCPEYKPEEDNMKQPEDNKTIDIFDEVREPLAPEVRTAMLELIFTPSEGHTVCDVEINTNTAPDNNPVHEAVQFYWGERCPEHEDGCPTCEAWKQYDAMRSMDLVIRGVARVALGHDYLHLGEFTLGEFIGRELDLSDDELARALEYLKKSNAPTS